MNIRISNRIHINYKRVIVWLLGVLVGFSFFLPEYISFMSENIDFLAEILQMSFLIFSAGVLGFRKVTLLIKCYPIYLMLGISLLLCIPVWGEDALFPAVSFCVGMVGLFLVVVCIDEEYIESFLCGLVFYLQTIVIINLISMAIFSEGMYNLGLERKCFFLGHVNGTVKICIPTICLLGYRNLKYRLRMGKINMLLLFACIFSLIACASYTAVAGLLIFVGVLIAGYFSDFRVLNGMVAIMASLATYFMINAEFIVSLLQRIGNRLSRYQSIAVRYAILKQADNAIHRSPLMGNGYMASYAKYIHINNYYPSSAHNIYKDILLNVGHIGLALFLVFLVLCLREVDIRKAREHVVVVAALFSWAIMWNFEPYFTSLGMNGAMIVFALMWRESKGTYDEKSVSYHTGL